jgi:putative chitinase
MCNLSVSNLLKIAPGAKAAPNIDKLALAINATAKRYNISSSPRRMAYFLSQLAKETQEFTKLEENLFYTDPVRVAQIFKSGFDLDKDGVVDPEEVEFAKGYIRNPQKLANRAYANRYGNGDEASGDGWRYRGMGLIHTTFKSNFLKASMAIYGDDRLVRQPELLIDTTTYEAGALAAGQFWKDNRLNELADADSFTAVTKVVNGSAVTVPERLVYLGRCNKLVW